MSITFLLLHTTGFFLLTITFKCSFFQLRLFRCCYNPETTPSLLWTHLRGQGEADSFNRKNQPWGMKILFCWSQHWKALSKAVRQFYTVSQLNGEVYEVHTSRHGDLHTQKPGKTHQRKGGWSHASNSMELSTSCTSRTLDCLTAVKAF